MRITCNGCENKRIKAKWAKTIMIEAIKRSYKDSLCNPWESCATFKKRTMDTSSCYLWSLSLNCSCWQVLSWLVHEFSKLVGMTRLRVLPALRVSTWSKWPSLSTAAQSSKELHGLAPLEFQEITPAQEACPQHFLCFFKYPTYGRHMWTKEASSAISVFKSP